MSASPAEIPDRRYEQCMDEADEQRNGWLEEWKARSLAYLSALYPETPWTDAAGEGESGSDEESGADAA